MTATIKIGSAKLSIIHLQLCLDLDLRSDEVNGLRKLNGATGEADIVRLE
jgi:hypothetical protein